MPGLRNRRHSLPAAPITRPSQMGELLGVESGGKVRSFNFNLALIDHLLSPKLCATVALGFVFFFLNKSTRWVVWPTTFWGKCYRWQVEKKNKQTQPSGIPSSHRSNLISLSNSLPLNQYPAPPYPRRHTPGLSRAPIGRSLGRPASCGDGPWRHFRQRRRVELRSWACFCSVGPWPDYEIFTHCSYPPLVPRVSGVVGARLSFRTLYQSLVSPRSRGIRCEEGTSLGGVCLGFVHITP